MQQVVLPTHDNTKAACTKKKLNPVEHQKQQQRLLREQIKAQRQKDKTVRQEEEESQKRLYKEERLHSGASSRRARQDVRKERKREERAACGPQECEHGIIKCRICNPRSAKADHRVAPAVHI
eukprot:jgi/Ulvmu1/9088/UM005_0183.1